MWSVLVTERRPKTLATEERLHDVPLIEEGNIDGVGPDEMPEPAKKQNRTGGQRDPYESSVHWPSVLDPTLSVFCLTFRLERDHSQWRSRSTLDLHR